MFAIAIDLRRTSVNVVAGTREPQGGTAPGAREAVRGTGLVPATDVPSLIAGFNGGFRRGARPLRDEGRRRTRSSSRADACTIAMTEGGELHIEPWKASPSGRGHIHVVAADARLPGRQWQASTRGSIDENTNWSAALGGGTIVRRSAVGLDATGKISFVAVSNRTSPRAIAVA